MKTQTTTNHLYCPQSAVRYARVLYELNIPNEAIQKTRELFTEVPQLQDVLVNPTIREEQKRKVIDQVFPAETRNFLKIACRYQRVDLLDDIFTAYDRYCDEQNKILKAVLSCVEPPSEVQLKEMQEFLCKKYGAQRVDVEIREDASLLGGFILHAKNDEYDWSLKGRLKRLEEKLTWR
jgi:F-type H+-transporting ATPase subunit delta